VLVVGFEKMEKGALGPSWADRENPVEKHATTMVDVQGFAQAPPTAQMFGGAGREYRWKYGTKKETFGEDQREGAQARGEQPVRALQPALTARGGHGSEEVFDPLTRYQCCPPTCGAAAAVLCSDDFAKKHGITKPGLDRRQAMTTDYPSSFEKSMIKMVGYDMTVNAAKKVYEQAGIGPEDVEVVELHDCFTANELLTYEGSASARRARPRSSSGTATTRTAAST
jgi:sterol carrier protein 2